MADEKDLEKVEPEQETLEATEGNAADEAVVNDTPAESAETSEASETEASEEDATPAENGKHIPDFRAGDVLRLGVRITEGDKVRTQYFEGMVLARKGAGISQTFTVRKIGAGGIAVERIFPLYSPSLVSFEVRRRGVVRRSKIYFLRDIVGSTANVIKERKVVRDRTQSQQAKAEKKAARAQRKAESAKSTKVSKKDSTRSSRRSATKTN